MRQGSVSNYHHERFCALALDFHFEPKLDES